VLAEAILRKTGAEVAHNFVARHLGDHTRRCDAQAVTIAIDNGGLRHGKGEHGQAVDENVVGLESEGSKRDAHRLVSRAKNIDRVDLHRIDNADRPGDGVVTDEIVVNFLPLFRQELFRVV
jgi:hypothetical protein